MSTREVGGFQKICGSSKRRREKDSVVFFTLEQQTTIGEGGNGVVMASSVLAQKAMANWVKAS